MTVSHSDLDRNAGRQVTGRQGDMDMLFARNEGHEHGERDDDDEKSIGIGIAGRDEEAHAKKHKNKRGRQVTFFITSGLILILLGEV